MDYEKNYAKYLKFITSYINRDGVDNFVKWLDSTDVSIAPASTKYHLSCRGGLVQHSLNVFYRLIKLMQLEFGDDCPYSKETIALVSLLHDVSKVNFYDELYRNVKNKSTGQWESIPYYAVSENRLLFATHEENSLYILSKFFNLSYEEELAIRYHMGTSTNEESQNRVYSAFNASKLAALLHTADLLAMTIDESEHSVEPPIYLMNDEHVSTEEDTVENTLESTKESGELSEQDTEREAIDTSACPF